MGDAPAPGAVTPDAPASGGVTPDAPASGTARGEAPARAALAGNPSDGYGGAVLALAFRERRAVAEIRPGRAGEHAPDSDLIRATIARFAREHAPAAAGCSISWSTTIPRSVGLGGSSAIVISVLRALCDAHGVSLAPAALAELALAVEVEELGIAAGLQDRAAQAHGGLTFMEFGGPEPAYETLAPALLPPLVVAWRCEASGESGAVHAPLRTRFERGEPAVVAGLHELGELARRARTALAEHDHDTFGRCVDASFDVRRRIVDLDPRHTEMVHTARAAGARANYTGSGGAIVAVCRDEAHRADVAARLAALGCETLSPACR